MRPRILWLLDRQTPPDVLEDGIAFIFRVKQFRQDVGISDSHDERLPETSVTIWQLNLNLHLSKLSRSEISRANSAFSKECRVFWGVVPC
jgi:hypothetical protein